MRARGIVWACHGWLVEGMEGRGRARNRKERRERTTSLFSALSHLSFFGALSYTHTHTYIHTHTQTGTHTLLYASHVDHDRSSPRLCAASLASRNQLTVSWTSPCRLEGRAGARRPPPSAARLTKEEASRKADEESVCFLRESSLTSPPAAVSLAPDPQQCPLTRCAAL